jgi:hypothetical protein
MRITEKPPLPPPAAAACDVAARPSPGAALAGSSEGMAVSADAAAAEGVADELNVRVTLLRLCPALALNVWV